MQQEDAEPTQPPTKPPPPVTKLPPGWAEGVEPGPWARGWNTE